MPKRSVEKGIQGALSLGAFGALQGNKFRKKYGSRAAQIGAGVGALTGFASGYLSGVPDPAKGEGIYDEVIRDARMNTLTNAQKTADVVGANAANVAARKNFGGSELAVGIEAANRGKVISGAMESLIPFEQNLRIRSAEDRLMAERVGEFEKREGWQDAMYAVGEASKQISDQILLDQDAIKTKADEVMAKTLPSNFGTWSDAEQAGWLQKKGITVPEGWAKMTPQDRMNYLSRVFQMSIAGPGEAVPGQRMPGNENWVFQPPGTEVAKTDEQKAAEILNDWEARKDAADRRATSRPVQTSAASQVSAGMPNVPQITPAPTPGFDGTVTQPGMPEHPDIGKQAVSPNVQVRPTPGLVTTPDDAPATSQRRIPWDSEPVAPSTARERAIPGGDTDPNVSTSPGWMNQWKQPIVTDRPDASLSVRPDVPVTSRRRVPWDSEPLTARERAIPGGDTDPNVSTSPGWMNEWEQPVVTDRPDASFTDTPGEAPASAQRPIRGRQRPPRAVPPPWDFLPEQEPPTGVPPPWEFVPRGDSFRQSVRDLIDWGEGGFYHKPFSDPTHGTNVGFGRSLTENGMNIQTEVIPFLKQQGIADAEIQNRLKAAGIPPDTTHTTMTAEQFNALFPTGITEQQGQALMDNDIDLFTRQVEYLIGKDVFEGLDTARKQVLIDMMYTLGPGDFSGFQRMIEFIKQGDFEKAANEMKWRDGSKQQTHTDWYNQVGPRRADPLLLKMRTGLGMGSPVRDTSQTPGVNTIPTALHDALPQEVKDEIAETAQTPPTTQEMREFARDMPQSHAAITAPGSPFLKEISDPHSFQVLMQTAALMGDAEFSRIIASMHALGA